MTEIGLTAVLGEYTPLNVDNSDPGKRAADQQQATNRKRGPTDVPSEQFREAARTRVDDFLDGEQRFRHSGVQERAERNVWPPSLISILQNTMATPCRHPSKPIFEFDTSVEAAEKNFIILMRKFGGDLHEALNAQQGTPLQYGSEFKPVSILAPIFSLHPSWEKMKTVLSDGSSWPLAPLDDQNRLLDIDDALAFGNHKGANQQPELLLKLVSDDVTRGFALPLPLDKIRRIPGVLLAPLNIQLQKTINERGEIIPKNRMTHDQSWKWQSGTSVNSRVDEEKLVPCYFGRALKRIINWCVAARRRFPGKRILATKLDVKAAFRRCHLNASTAVQTCTQLPELRLALMMLRLSFGGAPCPSEWGLISESICDLMNAILQHDDWDPLTLFAETAQAHVPPKEVLPDDVPFGIGRELIVDIPVDARGIVDVYIDDFIGLTIDLEGTDNAIRLERAPLLGLTAVSREVSPFEPLPRDDMDARAKLKAETGLTETKIILGWLLNFRAMTIALPENKFIAYSRAISDMLERGWTSKAELETNIGRWVHLGQIIPFIHHFLSRLRSLLRRLENNRRLNINEQCKADLEFLQTALEKCRNGVDMNTIAYRRPTHAYRSDSCPAGLGGYSDEGFAWRYYLPPDLQSRASNNLLEHIAAIITPWVDIIAGRLKSGDCALSMTDSTTSEGWLKKSNFIEEGESPIQATIRLEVARHHASQYLTKGIREYSQWFPGVENQVADALSRDDDRSDEELTKILRSHCPSQVPQHFEIVPLPSEIISWLTSLLRRLPQKPELAEAHTKTTLGRGPVTRSTAIASDSPAIISSTESPDSTNSQSWELSPWLCVKGDFRDQLMVPWLKSQSKVPSTQWLRPSGKTAERTPTETQNVTLGDFYSGN